MNKSTFVRTSAFVGALGASAALVAATVSTTGAYFTDTKQGNIRSGTGHVRVNTSDTNLNFDDLLPGDYKTNRVEYTADTTGASEDIWMVFPDDGTAQALVGRPNVNGGGLGRFGHLKIASSGGANFVSNNLSNPRSDSADQAKCAINEFGHGGSDALATSTNNADPGSYLAYCAPANAILLHSGLASGATGYVDIEFGFTRVLKSGQDSGRQQTAAYKIVATQHGVRPDDVNNPAN